MSSSLLGFSGSRVLTGHPLSSLRAVVAGACAAGCSLAVGCCPSGADAEVVSAAAACGVAPRVFAAAVRSRFALAARSAALVRFLASSSGALVVAPFGPCPAGVAPSRAWSSGVSPSGSWSSCALAVGLSVPVFVLVSSPRSLPPWPGGCWVSCSLFGVSCFRWASSSPSLFSL